MKTISVRITGKVQGVFYRKSTTSKARELGINGRVWNEDDGSVKLIATGDDQQLDQLLDWCRQGPDRAVVTTVEVKDIPLQEFNDFNTER